LWLIGLVIGLFGPIIHLLLIVAAVMFAYSMFFGQRRTY
jgi:hypothetical protein